MSIQELITILGYSDLDPFSKVRIKVNHSGALEEVCDILNYSVKDNSITLNIVVTNLADVDDEDKD